MTARDWRAGELTMLLLALVLAVAALASVGFLADRMRHGLERDARQMIAADFVVRADHPVDPAVRAGSGVAETRDRDHHHLSQHDQRDRCAAAVSRLAAIKGVSPGYPLRGAVRIAPAPGAADAPAAAIPAPGTVWLDPALARRAEDARRRHGEGRHAHLHRRRRSSRASWIAASASSTSRRA